MTFSYRPIRPGLLALLASLAGLPAAAQRFFDPSAYRVVFEDQFRYPSADSLLGGARPRWSSEMDWGNAHWAPTPSCVNNPDPNFAFLPTDVRTLPNPEAPADGLAGLDCTYHAPPLTEVASGVTGHVARGTFYKSSGMLRALYRGDTDDPVPNFRFGIFEVRCRMPATPGRQAAFWLWGGPCGSTVPGALPGENWELDAFETYNNGQQRVFQTTLHANPGTGHRSVGWESFVRRPDTEFHTYTLAWGPDFLYLFVDGKRIVRREARPGQGATRGIPQTSMSLVISAHYMWDCLNNNHCDTLATGAPNPQTCPPVDDPFLIDYVRVYKPRTLNPDGTWPDPLTRRRPRGAPAPATATAAPR